MPFYNFRFCDHSGEIVAQQRAFRALNLEDAKKAALSWAGEWRRLSGDPADHSAWPLVIATGEDTLEHRRGTAIFAQQDVRPGDWREADKLTTSSANAIN